MNKFHGSQDHRSFSGNSTLRIAGVAVWVFRYSGRSRARTGPYSTENPDLRITSGQEIPGAPSWGTMIFLWSTTDCKAGFCYLPDQFFGPERAFARGAPDIYPFGIEDEDPCISSGKR